MDILTFLLIGIVAGWFAGLMVQGHGFGAISNAIVGIIGAFVGGSLFRTLDFDGVGFWGAFGMAVAGAVVFLLGANLFTRKSTTKAPSTRARKTKKAA